MERTLRENSSGEMNLQFKLLSAIGIIIIVAGHCYQGGISLAYEWFPPYSFNIALLVFISGYFYKPTHEEHFLKYIWKRAKRLVIPAYLWNIVYGLFFLLMSNFGYTIGGKVNLYNLFLMPFVDGEAFVYNLGSWFVYPLFCVCVFNVLFRRLLKLVKLDNEYLIMIIYLVIGLVGVQISIALTLTYKKGLLLLLLRTMFFLPCFQLGRLYKAKLEQHDNLNSIAYFAIIFGVQLIILTFFKDIDYSPSKCNGFDNGFIVPYLTALTGIAFWLRISKLLTPIIKNWKFIRLIADNTYSIMIHHMLGFMCVKWLFYLVSVLTPLFADFKIYSLKTSIWYFYLPNGLKQYCILYLAGGIFVPILIKKLCDLASKPVKKKFNALKRKNNTDIQKAIE